MSISSCFKYIWNYNKNRDILWSVWRASDFFYAIWEYKFYTYEDAPPIKATSKFLNIIEMYMMTRYQYSNWTNYKIFREKVLVFIKDNEIRNLNKVDDTLIAVFKLQVLV